MTGPIHLAHPVQAGMSMCGFHLGDGARVATGGRIVTCTGCRNVVRRCRAARIGRTRRSKQ